METVWRHEWKHEISYADLLPFDPGRPELDRSIGLETEIGIKYETTDVGDRFVYACMRENGYTLGTGCQVPIGTPRENFDAFIFAARKYGRGARKGMIPLGIAEEALNDVVMNKE